MSEFLNRLTADLKEAMRAKDGLRRDTLRMVLNDLKNAGIDKKGREGFTEQVDSPAEYLSDGECLKVLRGALKRRKEAAEQYRAGNREELAAKEEAEAEVIQGYLPQPLSSEELQRLAEAAVADSGASSMADMGKVMKAVMAKVGDRADGKAVSAAVKAALS
ncbi:MAG: GatB/YqeY domain-containing protein [Planctomycetota bacterium]|nr:MAG: GatB/YqeY domain-containing protein [Planctomycetota bacterium]